ncbi:hypothetical protein HY623_02205 [Candidatus Uhrbacteria bacterium]|nr:hypothetical protein [Candidatus Uhrbacteria bacterium]
MKKISVCHGKKCGYAGAVQLMQTLKNEYESGGVPVEERGCCGRCERHNTIVVLDDNNTEIIVSDLNPSTIQEQFIDNPAIAIAREREENATATAKLDAALNDDIL